MLWNLLLTCDSLSKYFIHLVTLFLETLKMLKKLLTNHSKKFETTNSEISLLHISILGTVSLLQKDSYWLSSIILIKMLHLVQNVLLMRLCCKLRKVNFSTTKTTPEKQLNKLVSGWKLPLLFGSKEGRMK